MIKKICFSFAVFSIIVVVFGLLSGLPILCIIGVLFLVCSEFLLYKCKRIEQLKFFLNKNTSNYLTGEIDEQIYSTVRVRLLNNLTKFEKKLYDLETGK